MLIRFLTFWKIIKIILFSNGLLNDFCLHDTIEKEVKSKKYKLNLSDANLNLYVLSIYIVVNFIYFWIITLISMSDIFYDFINESYYFYKIDKSSIFKLDKIHNKFLNEIVSRWYFPKYEGMILNLIANNKYILPSA